MLKLKYHLDMEEPTSFLYLNVKIHKEMGQRIYWYYSFSFALTTTFHPKIDAQEVHTSYYYATSKLLLVFFFSYPYCHHTIVVNFLVVMNVITSYVNLN